MKQLSDESLCELIRRAPSSPNSRDAFAELYRRHRDAAMAQAYLSTRNREQAEDLVSEAFTGMLRALCAGKGPTESVLGYVLVALRSSGVRAASGRSPLALAEPESLGQIADEATSEFTERLAERDQILRAYAQLSKREQQVLRLLDIEDLGPTAAAGRLNMTAGALRVAAHRARRRLGTFYLQQHVESCASPCSHAAARLADFVRGSLNPRQRERVREHLAVCDACAEQADRLRRLQSQLRAVVGPILVGTGVGGGLLQAGAGGSGAHAVLASEMTHAGSGGTMFAAVSAKPAAWVCLGAGLIAVTVGVLLPPKPDAASPPIRPAAAGASSPDSARLPVETGAVFEEAERRSTPRPPEHSDIRDDTTPYWKLRDG